MFGFGYPLVMTGFAPGRVPAPGERQPDQASTARSSARSSPRRRSRGRATSTSGRRRRRPPTTPPARRFANLGPTNPDLAKNVADDAQAILKLEGPYNPGLTIHDIPVDAVTTSGSGIDPDISPANAQLQSRRVAAVRHLPLATVQQLIAGTPTAARSGFFGEPGVNVLELNLALDKREARRWHAQSASIFSRELVARRRSATRSRSSTRGCSSRTR